MPLTTVAPERNLRTCAPLLATDQPRPLPLLRHVRSREPTQHWQRAWASLMAASEMGGFAVPSTEPPAQKPLRRKPDKDVANGKLKHGLYVLVKSRATPKTLLVEASGGSHLGRPRIIHRHPVIVL